MGIALWLGAAGISFGAARLIPYLKLGFVWELAGLLPSSFILGAIATALDFGGWREPDWRAGLFVLAGSFALIGVQRLLFFRQPRPLDP